MNRPKSREAEGGKVTHGSPERGLVGPRAQGCESLLEREAGTQLERALGPVKGPALCSEKN